MQFISRDTTSTMVVIANRKHVITFYLSVWLRCDFTWHPKILREYADSSQLHLHQFLKVAQQKCIIQAVLLHKYTGYTRKTCSLDEVQICVQLC